MPFEFKNTLLYCAKNILNDDFMLARSSSQIEVLSEDAKLFQNSHFGLLIFDFGELIIKLPVFHEEIETLLDFKAIPTFEAI